MYSGLREKKGYRRIFNSYVQFCIFITVAGSYSFDSWQLLFWDIIAIRLESIMYH